MLGSLGVLRLVTGLLLSSLLLGCNPDSTEIHTEVEGEGLWIVDPDTGLCALAGVDDATAEPMELFDNFDACQEAQPDEDVDCSETPVWILASDGVSCLELPSDCDVPEGVEFFLDPDHCAMVPLGTGCDAGCPDGTVCDQIGCGDDAQTRCVPLPGSCDEMMEAVDMTVCGCDGVTYASECRRLLAGVGLDQYGACEP